MLNTYTMDWIIIPSHAPESVPHFGRESEVSLDFCMKRIRGVWESYNCSEESARPLAWAYAIKDRHGRTVDADRLVNGEWMDGWFESRVEFYASMKMNGPVYP